MQVIGDEIIFRLYVGEDKESTACSVSDEVGGLETLIIHSHTVSVIPNSLLIKLDSNTNTNFKAFLTFLSQVQSLHCYLD